MSTGRARDELEMAWKEAVGNPDSRYTGPGFEQNTHSKYKSRAFPLHEPVS